MSIFFAARVAATNMEPMGLIFNGEGAPSQSLNALRAAAGQDYN
jgi:hypothetical protein